MWVVQKNQNAKFFVLGWFWIFSAMTIYMLVLNGVIPYNYITRNINFIGCALECLMFSWALANRINILQQQAHEAQQQTIAEIEKNAKLIAEQKDILEIKVIERTRDLLNSEEELKQNLEELTVTQEVLETQKLNLEYALDELQNTQTQLIQSEKMASLGQLVASVAHEINTPLGAIRSSVGMNTHFLGDILKSLPAFLNELGEIERNTFLQTAQDIAFLPIINRSTREKRQKRNEIIEKLDDLKIEKSYEIAEFIVEMANDFDLFAYPVLLQSPYLFTIMEMLGKVMAIQMSNQNIQVATERASKIIFALKNFSRQDNTNKKEDANINESLETVLTLYHSQLKQGVEIVKNFADLPTILCYPDELIQVWTNLIHNAIQAMEGKGTLTIETKLAEEKLQVSITDTGAGIPTDIQSKIFNAFFTTKKLGEGSGLGLDIVRKIIDKHAGKIWFETEVGKGTTFFVEIPC
jgi:signal transduction histidine kinase